MPADAAEVRWLRERAAGHRPPKRGAGRGRHSWMPGGLPLWSKSAWDGLRARSVDCTADRVLYSDAIVFQSRAGGAIKLNFCLLKYGHGTDQIQLGQR